MPTVHTAILKDPLTGENYHHSQPISVSRLLRFNFPRDWSGPEPSPAEVEANRDLVEKLSVGAFVAVQPDLPGLSQRVYVGRVERTFPAERLVEVILLRTADTGRSGPWQRRRWVLWMCEDGWPRDRPTRRS